MNSRILTLFTRTPLHVGAGASVGAIDQPIIRERHTGLPIIPGSSLKGVLADLWNHELLPEDDKTLRVTAREEKRGERKVWVQDQVTEAAWLFGSDNDKVASAGALSFGEARLLAFPIRSAKGSFAWITSPLLLARAARDGVPGITPLTGDALKMLDGKDGDARALFDSAGPLSLGEKIVLEDYALTRAGTPAPALSDSLAALFPDEAYRGLLNARLVIVSDGMMSFFARTACEIAQHVRINDATGTASEGGLFNQENAPADTLFYAVLHATPPRSAAHRDAKKTPADALTALDTKLKEVAHTLQVGGDATTGLGYCTARLA